MRYLNAIGSPRAHAARMRKVTVNGEKPWDILTRRKPCPSTVVENVPSATAMVPLYEGDSRGFFIKNWEKQF